MYMCEYVVSIFSCYKLHVHVYTCIATGMMSSLTCKTLKGVNLVFPNAIYLVYVMYMYMCKL